MIKPIQPLKLYQFAKENIPFVFDYHHHMANLCEEPLEELLPAILKLGHIQISLKFTFPPEIGKEFRAHAEYIDLEFIKPFLHIAKKQS